MQKYILNFLYSILIRNFLKLIIGVKFENRQYLKESDQYIIVANHNSHLDTMAIMAALPSACIHKVHPVAAMDYFGKSKVRTFFSKYFVNALLIQRKKDAGGDDPISLMLDALDKGYSLILFPEGTRGAPEVMQKFKKGVAVILKERPLIPYLPVFIKGLGKTMPKGDALVVPYNSIVRFGKPNTASSEDLEAIVEQIEEDILKLK